MNAVSSEMDYKKLYEESQKEISKLKKEGEMIEKQEIIIIRTNHPKC